MKQYKFGFSIKGLIAFLLVMAPNIVWMIAPPVNDVLAGNSAAAPALDIVQNVCRWMVVALLILLVNKSEKKNKLSKIFIAAAALCLLVYYVSWALYYIGYADPWMVVIGMAAAPSLYFIFVALWLNNYPAVVPGIIFAVIHTAITFINYK